METKSIISFCEKLKCKSVVAIFDCCYSGSTELDKKIKYDEVNNISDYVGKGIEILASTACDDVSRLGPEGNHSLFTGALSSAMLFPKKIKQGRVSLQDIVVHTRELIDTWNISNKSETQKPVIRGRMTGTLYFDVAEYEEYKQQKLCWETNDYKVCSVEPLNSLEEKRLCVFVIIDKEQDVENLSAFTLEISKRIKKADVYSNEKSERRFKGKKASAIWCYFGIDQEDIINHLYYAYSIWADKSVQKKYYRDNNSACIVNGVWICENTSYAMLKKMNESTISREEYIQLNKSLLFSEMTLMDEITNGLQEVKNNNMELTELLLNCIPKAKEIKKKYLEMTDLDVSPVDLKEWSDEIMAAAGYVLDIALILEKCDKKENLSERELWLIQNAERQYNMTLDAIKNVEKDLFF